MLKNDRDRVRGSFNRDVDRLTPRRMPLWVWLMLALTVAVVSMPVLLWVLAVAWWGTR